MCEGGFSKRRRALKIIHTADIHLGSKMDSRLGAEEAKERQGELRATLNRMIELARREGVGAVLISGDLFDTDRPLKKDKEFFYRIVRAYPEITFFYLRGNHDIKESYEENLPNLKTFSSEWKSYELDGACVSGIELSCENYSSLYSTLSLDRSKVNIVMLHAEVSDSVARDKISPAKLQDKGIDYLALGHIHSYSSARLGGRGEYAYPGCLEGRGFDEIGEKGFILLDTEGGISHRFVPFSSRKIELYKIDISDCESAYDAYLKARSQIKCSSSDLVRVLLTGECDFDTDGIERELERLLCADFYFASVKNLSLRKIDTSSFDGELSMRAEFVRGVMNDSSLSDSDKAKVIDIGLKALYERAID